MAPARMPDVRTDSPRTSPVEVAWLPTAVAGASLIAVTFGLARYGYGLLLPDMRADLGVSATAAGAISSLSYGSYFVANLAVIRVIEVAGVRAALLLATSTASVGMGVIAAAPSTIVLAVGVALAGAASGFAFPPYADIVHRQVTQRRRATVWAIVSSGTGWGVAIAGPVALLAGDQWRWAWASFVVITIATGLLAHRAAPAGLTVDTSVAGSLPSARDMLARPGAWRLLSSALAIGAGSSVWWSFSVDALRRDGADTSPARWVYAACGAASLLASFAGYLVTKSSLRLVNQLAAVLVATTLVTFGLSTAYPGAAAGASIVFGAAYSTIIATQGLWSAHIFADRPSAGLAALNTALTVGTLSGPAIAGAVIDTAGYAIAFAVAALSTLPALVLIPPRRRPTS